MTSTAASPYRLQVNHWNTAADVWQPMPFPGMTTLEQVQQAADQYVEAGRVRAVRVEQRDPSSQPAWAVVRELGWQRYTA